MGQLLFVPNLNTLDPVRSIIWRPGGVATAGVATTWPEVEAHIEETQGFLVVSVDTSLAPAIVPADADTECYGRLTLQPYTFNIQNGVNIQVADGGRLKNLFTIRTLGIYGVPTTRPFILLDIGGTLLITREGGAVVLGPGSTVSAVRIEGNFCEIASFEGARFQNDSGTPDLATVDIADTVTQVLHAIISAAGSFLPFQPAYGPDLFQGGTGGTTILQIFDSSAPPVVQTSYLGTYFQLPMSNAIGDAYQDGLVTPPTGATTVQGLLDILKRRVTGAGNTASRPVIPDDIDTGGMYFDEDLGYPIYSNGTVYVDSQGNPV